MNLTKEQRQNKKRLLEINLNVKRDDLILFCIQPVKCRQIEKFYKKKKKKTFGLNRHQS